MKQYIKPTIMLAAGTGSTGTTCNLSKEDLDLIKDIIGEENFDNAFAITESCTVQVPFEDYCKFTSTEFGAKQAFTS